MDTTSRIARVEVGRFDYDFVGEFKFFKPGLDGKIRRPSILVRITDESGGIGWGQAVPVPSWTYETPETVETTLRNYLANAVLGADPTNLQDIHQRMDQAIRPGFSVGQPLCKAAIDLACYDLKARRLGISVSQMLGGAQLELVQLSWTVASPRLDDVEKQLEEGRARGYHHFNIKVGYPQTPEYDIQLARKVRQFSPQGFLWADANTGYTLETALDILPKLADAGVQVIESPLPPAQIRGYQALKRLGALPVFMDEGIVSPVEAEEFIRLGMVDGITLKPARNAGLWPSERIISLAMDHRVALLGSGLSDPDLSLAAAVHLYASIGIDKPCALNGPQYLANSLAENPLWPQGDLLAVPLGPGLGLKMSERAEVVLSVVAEI
jgi:L-alanine-DL-glutamate epimerase-like enolase superfamily enzyme